MAFIIQSPFPGPVLTNYLPNPRLGDSVGATGSLQFKRSMNGTRYAYVKSRDRRKKLLWTFALTKAKAMEMQSFFEVYNGVQVQITDHLGKVYLGNFTSNPFEFEAVGRSVAAPGNNTMHQIQLEFEGFEQV
jgi:hypothetical protein